QLQLTNEKPGHDGLACTSVVCEKKPNLRGFQEKVVDRFQLVRQRVDSRDREAEVRIELVGNPEGVGLDSESQELAVAVVGQRGVLDLETSQLSARQRDAPELLALQSDQPHRPAIGTARANSLHPHRFAEERPRYHLARTKRVRLIDGNETS